MSRFQVTRTSKAAARFVPNAHGNIDIRIAESIYVNQAWSAGLRTLHDARYLDSGAMAPMDLTDRRAATYFDARNSAGTYHMVPGVVVVERSSFKGREYVTLIVHPDDEARFACPHEHEDCLMSAELAHACRASMLPKADERDRKILAAIRGYKSGPYRKEALARAGATDVDMDRLVSAGLLSRNKAGAIALTNAGRMLAVGV